MKFSKNLSLSSGTTSTKSKSITPKHALFAPSDRNLTELSEKQFVHTVTPKQTYYAISRLYGLTVQQLYDWNNLSEDSVLSIGQQLVVNVSEKQQESVSKPYSTVQTGHPSKLIIENNDSPAPAISKKTITYCTVQTGQTLYRIALVNKVLVKDLMRWNNLPNYTIEVGQVLQIGEKGE